MFNQLKPQGRGYRKGEFSKIFIIRTWNQKYFDTKLSYHYNDLYATLNY